MANIKDISVFDIMLRYGDWEGVPSTKQIRCPFHGQDTKPSARVYKDTGVLYCFVCGRYDSIKYVQTKENVSYKEARKLISYWYNIPLMENENTDLTAELNNIFQENNPNFVDNINAIFSDTEHLLLKKKRQIAFSNYLKLSNLLDQIESAKTENIASEILIRELKKIQDALRKG